MTSLYRRLQHLKLRSRLEHAQTRGLWLKNHLRKLRALLRPHMVEMVLRRSAASENGRVRDQQQSHHPADGLILAYHRVNEIVSDPQKLSVRTQRFAEQLDVLQRKFTVLPLRVMQQRLRDGKSVAGCISVTFDDGYADNLHVAKPLMQRFGIPSTIFIATDHIDSRHGFWWDQIEQTLLGGFPIPRKLRLEIKGRHYRWDLEDDADADPQNTNSRQYWSVEEAAIPTRRQQVYMEVHKVLFNLPPEERGTTLAQIRTWADPTGIRMPLHRALTTDELLTLSADELVEIGAHTASHPALSRITQRQQQEEISGGKARLEQMLGRKTHNFAYPYGSLTSFNAHTMDIVRANEFESACTTFADTVRPGCNPYQLPRLLVRNWGGDEFEHRLRTRLGN